MEIKLPPAQITGLGPTLSGSLFGTSSDRSALQREFSPNRRPEIAPAPSKSGTPGSAVEGTGPMPETTAPLKQSRSATDEFAGASEAGTQPPGMFNANMFGD